MRLFRPSDETELTDRERKAIANENSGKGKAAAVIRSRVMLAETGRMTGGNHRSQRELGHVKK